MTVYKVLYHDGMGGVATEEVEADYFDYVETPALVTFRQLSPGQIVAAFKYYAFISVLPKKAET